MIEGITNKFAIVENHYGGMKLQYGWCCVISEMLNLYNYLEHVQQPRMIQAFIASGEQLKTRNHHNNRISALVDAISQVKGISVAHAHAEVADKYVAGCIDLIEKYGTIYIQRSGGYFGHSSDIKIIKVTETVKFVWPSDKLTMKDINISQWAGGKHWYVSTKDGQRVTDGDMDKFNTYKYAEEVAERFIKENSIVIDSAS
jgi:hypothetical protein